MSSKKTNARIEKWRLMLNSGIEKDLDLLKSRIRKGIPAAMRAMAWPEIVKLRDFVKEKQVQYTYQKLVNKPSKSTYDITLDIPRTFPEQQDSKVLRKSLNNVLKAISVVYPKLGYCQGMNFLALRMLQVLDDEETFWMLNLLLDRDRGLLRNFADPRRIEEESYVMGRLLKTHLPDVSRCLEEQNIQMEIPGAKWLLTIFSSTMPQEIFYRIFEVYLNEGWTIIYGVAITLFRLRQKDFLKNSFQKNLFLLNAQINHIANADAFMQEVYKTDITQPSLQQHHSAYRQSKGHEEFSLAGSQVRQRQLSHLNHKLPQPQQERQPQHPFQSKSEEITLDAFRQLANFQKPDPLQSNP